MCYKHFKIRGLNYIGMMEEQGGCSPSERGKSFNILTPSSVAEIQNPQSKIHTEGFRDGSLK
jgi:hypothetical protein